MSSQNRLPSSLRGAFQSAVMNWACALQPHAGAGAVRGLDGSHGEGKLCGREDGCGRWDGGERRETHIGEHGHG